MKMNSITILGVALILLGIVALAYQGITYTTREKIVDIGPLQATAEREKTIPCHRYWEAYPWPVASPWLLSAR